MIELKLKWTNGCVLPGNGNDNDDANSNIFLQLKTQNYMPLLSHYQQRTNKNYQNILGKGVKDQFIGINVKQKRRHNK